jgi:hypothetical protein
VYRSFTAAVHVQTDNAIKRKDKRTPFCAEMKTNDLLKVKLHFSAFVVKKIVTASNEESTRIYRVRKILFSANKTQTCKHGQKKHDPARGQNPSS